MGRVRENRLEECCWQGLKGKESNFFPFPIRIQTMDCSIVEFFKVLSKSQPPPSSCIHSLLLTVKEGPSLPKYSSVENLSNRLYSVPGSDW